MDEDKETTLSETTFIQPNPDNAQGSLSMTNRELSLQMTVYSVANTLADILSQAFGQDTQEPPFQSTGAVPDVQVTQEPSIQSTEANLRMDATPLFIEPLTFRPMDTTNSSMPSEIFSLNSASMIIYRSLHKESLIYMTTNNLSLRSLFSSQMSDLSFSCENMRKQLVKSDILERQSPVQAKGEVTMRKEILSLSEDTLDVKSHESVCVSSDEITLQEHKDLGCFSNIILGD